jgi:hypothetical protein
MLQTYADFVGKVLVVLWLAGIVLQFQKLIKIALCNLIAWCNYVLC